MEKMDLKRLLRKSYEAGYGLMAPAATAANFVAASAPYVSGPEHASIILVQAFAAQCAYRKAYAIDPNDKTDASNRKSLLYSALSLGATSVSYAMSLLFFPGANDLNVTLGAENNAFAASRSGSIWHYRLKKGTARKLISGGAAVVCVANTLRGNYNAESILPVLNMIGIVAGCGADFTTSDKIRSALVVLGNTTQAFFSGPTHAYGRLIGNLLEDKGVFDKGSEPLKVLWKENKGKMSVSARLNEFRKKAPRVAGECLRETFPVEEFHVSLTNHYLKGRYPAFSFG